MKIFLSHRFTGEDLNKLTKILSGISKCLESKNLDVFCSTFKIEFFEEQKFSTEEIYGYCNERLVEHDIILFFIKSHHPSHGMQLELDVAIRHNKKIILLIDGALKFNKFRKNAHEIIEFNKTDSINSKISTINFSK